MEHLSLRELFSGKLEGGGSFTGDPEGYVNNSGYGHLSPVGAPLGNLEGGSFTRDTPFPRLRRTVVTIYIPTTRIAYSAAV